MKTAFKKNKNKILPLVLSLFLLFTGWLTVVPGSQAPLSPLEIWVKTYDGGFHDGASSVAVDSNDNIIVTGVSQNISYSGDWVTIKYDSSGTELWTQIYDSGDNDYTGGLAVDSGDNIIVAGSTYDGVDEDWVIKKYSSSGTELWTQIYDTGTYDYIDGVAVDSSDNIIVAGTTYNGVDEDMVITKYSSSGTEIWNKTYDSGDEDYSEGVAVDSNDNIIVNGDSADDCFTIKYSSSGTVLWTRALATNDGDGVAVDSNDNIIVIGETESGVNDSYVTVKYSSSGSVLWTRTYDSGYDDYINGVAVNPQDDIIVTGESYSGAYTDFYTIAYDSNGTELGNQTFDYGDYDSARGVAVDSDFNIIVTGNTDGVGLDGDFLTVKYAGSEFNAIDITPPEITDVYATPAVQMLGGYVNITCTVIDTKTDVDTVKVNMTSPFGTVFNFTMLPGPGHTFYFNSNYVLEGTYTYFIWANDTRGNSIISASYQFHIATIDSLEVTYSSQNGIPDTIISTHFFLDCYAGAFNDTHGFVAFVDATWNLQNSGGSNASINTTSGESVEFFSGWFDGTATVTADDGNGHTDSVVFTIDSSVFSKMIFQGWNMIGWSPQSSTVAESLGQNITGSTVVTMFDGETQAFISHVVGVPHDNFVIGQYMGVFVYTTITSIWHGEG